MEASSQKGQALVELTFVLVAIVAFALMTLTQWEKYRAETTKYFFTSERK